MSRPLILYHAACADGFASCWAAWRKYGSDADYLPVRYNEPPPPEALAGNRQVFILDFSYPRDVILALAAANDRVVCLDHHRSAQQDIAGLTADDLTITFDMAKSGARLSWEHFHPTEQPSWLVDYVEDRDLWKWKLSKSREVSAAIGSHPFDFGLWNDWHQNEYSWFHDLAKEGSAILRYQSNVVASAVKNATETTIGGHRVLAVNATSLQSEIAGELAAGRPFGACFVVNAQGRKVYSLRSRDGGIDVSEVAKSLGGGGHKAASGYTEPADPH